MALQPAIKWSGSKRSQADEIFQYFPKGIKTYYEPFLGGASMLAKVLTDPSICVKEYICSDLNADLIALWNLIKVKPKEVSDYYEKLWNELNVDDDKERKKEYFYSVRERYNKNHSPLDFMFIMRTTTNGMPRYNSKGDFNNSFHVTRDGIQPKKLFDILLQWSDLLRRNNVNFISSSYDFISADKEDFIYLDPPYANTKGMYYGAIDNDKLFDFLRKQPCKYALSFDGKSEDGKVDMTYEVPKDVYTNHYYIKSGNSSFRRVIGSSKDTIIYESLYVKQ